MTDTYTIQQILEDEYLNGMGAIGHDSILAMFSDYADGRITDEWIEEHESTREEVLSVLIGIAQTITSNGWLYEVRTPDGWQQDPDLSRRM